MDSWHCMAWHGMVMISLVFFFFFGPLALEMNWQWFVLFRAR